MNNWKNILLKSNQIAVGSSALDTRELPEEEVEEGEDKCCMEAAKVWVDTYNKIDAKHYGGPESWGWFEKYTVEMLINKYDTEDFCEQFRKVLEKEGRRDSSYPFIAKFQKALWTWQDCEKK